jgi:AAA domain
LKVTRPGEGRLLKALLYGPSGHGKTTFAATAQLDRRTHPALLIDFEGGAQSLAGLDIDMVEVRSWANYDSVYRELASGKTPYRTLILDSISETGIFAQLDLLNDTSSNRRDPDLLEQRDWGKLGVKMRRLLRQFRDLPMHVIFTSLARESEEPRVGLVKRPALSGQASEDLVGMVHVAAYLALLAPKEEEFEDQRALLLKNYSKFRVKVRTKWGETDVPDEIIEGEEREFATRGVSILLDTLGYAPEPKATKKEKASR